MLSRLLHILPLRLRSLFRSPLVDRDLEDEMRYHLDRQTEDLVRRGIPEHEAALLARRQLGNATRIKEDARETRGFAWLESIVQDLRQSALALRRTPGFTAVCLLTLALGIGATCALFAVLDVALLHPLSANQPDRLVWLEEFSTQHEPSGGNPARLLDWQKARSFSATGGFYTEGLVWRSAEGPRRLIVLRTFGDLQGVLQPKIAFGRAFTPAESHAAGQPVALLTDAAFRKYFHADRAVLNRTIRLNNVLFQPVGVLSADLNFPEDVDIWAAAPVEFQNMSREAAFLSVVARLANGVALPQAQAEIDVLASRMAAEYPATDRGRSARLGSLEARISQDARKPLLMVFGAVAGVLLIGCLNIAGLLLARGLARRREATIRVSVGAGYYRLVRLFFCESLLLALAGGVVGLALAFALLDVLKAALPADIPHLAGAAISPLVLLFAFGVSLLSALLFGALPSWQFARTAQTRSMPGHNSPVRSLLVVCQVAFSLVLLVTAVLLANSFWKMRSRELGFNSQNAYSFALNLPWDSSAAVIDSVSARTLEQLAALPGASAFGVVDRLPLQGGSQSRPLLVRGKTFSPALADKQMGWRTASPGFFAAAGIPLLSGSMFRSPSEVVVSQGLAAALFPDESPIGHEIASRSTQPKWLRIVGVVGGVPTHVTDTEPALELYVPWGSDYWPMMNFVVRTDRPLSGIARFVRERVQPLAADQIFSPVSTLDDLNAAARSPQRTGALLVGCFAAIALALAAIGIFGLLAQETVRRTREIGIRLALGEQPSSIAYAALARGLKLAFGGVVLGIAGAWFASRLLHTLLFGIEPHDPLSFTVAPVVLLAVAALAALIPALRAARIDPIRALRHE